MSLSNAAEAAIMDLLFLNTDFANVGDAGGLRGSVVAGSYYVALHSSDPGETGDQTTNEMTGLTGYARKAVPRSGSGFTRSAGVISNVAAVLMDTITAGTATATHFSIGTALSGAGVRLVSGALTASLILNPGIAPNFAIGALTSTAE